ncbi:MAG: DUF1501 domain-containing protein [Planctomycetota bacterium]
MNEPILSRRDLLGGIAALPWLSRLRRSRADDPALILVWLDGGMSHLDTFDAKPSAPIEIRGDTKSIAGAIDGSFVNAWLPKLAARLDRATLIRNLGHGEGNHDRGTHFHLTGARPTIQLEPPSLGALASRTAESPSDLPSYVAIPAAPIAGGAGCLPASCAPFATGGDPSRTDFAVRNLAARADPRTADLLAILDSADDGPRSEAERAHDHFVRRAQQLSSAPASREAFDLKLESPARRERFGRHRLGQSCLLAARLVAHGVKVALVRDDGWDHHQRIAAALETGFPPKLQQLDDGVAALLDDLRDGPLAGRAIVCVASEFGRTPRLNALGGRDHWPRAQSVLLAGTGVGEGVLVGSTDAHGEEPLDEALSPADLFATLVHLLRIDAEPLRAPDGRMVRVVGEGASPIAAALARR